MGLVRHLKAVPRLLLFSIWRKLDSAVRYEKVVDLSLRYCKF